MKRILPAIACLMAVLMLTVPVQCSVSPADYEFPAAQAKLAYQIDGQFHFRWAPSGWTGTISYTGNQTIAITAVYGNKVDLSEHVEVKVKWPLDAKRTELSFPEVTDGHLFGNRTETGDHWAIHVKMTFTDRRRTSQLQDREWVTMYACQHGTSKGADWARTGWGTESIGEYTIEWIGNPLSDSARVYVTSRFSGQTDAIPSLGTYPLSTAYGSRSAFHWSTHGRTSGTGQGAISWDYGEEYFWDKESGILLLYSSVASSPDGDAYAYTQRLVDTTVLANRRTTSYSQSQSLATVIGASTTHSSTESRIGLTTSSHEILGPDYTVAVAGTMIGVVAVVLLVGYALRSRKANTALSENTRSHYVKYIAKLEELKARGDISEKTYLRLKDEYLKRITGDT